MSPTTCPFSEISTTFNQSQTGFLGVEANPLEVFSTTFRAWTVSLEYIYTYK